MKFLLMSLMASGVSSWVTARVACAQEEVGDGHVRVITRCVEKQGDGENVFVIDGNAIGDGGFAWVTSVDDDGDDDGRSEKKRRRVIMRHLGHGDDSGWLGVSIANVSKALADQLDLDGDGVIIQNVIDGSPADEGGLKAHDVIIMIDGKDVENGTGRAVSLIKANKPGDEVDIVILRDGREKELTITLGSRAGAKGNFIWKFDRKPDAELEDRIHTFGMIMRPGDDGEWSIEDLGDLAELKELPKHLRMFLPKSGRRLTEVFLENGENKVKTRVERDGNVLVIEQGGDGEITVTRVDRDGDESEKVYADADELREADEEAYDFFEDTNAHIVVGVPSLDDLSESLQDLDFHFEFDTNEWTEKVADWKVHLEESLGEVREAHSEAMEELQELLEGLKINTGTEELDLSGLRGLFRDGGGVHVLPHMGALRLKGKPQHSFEVRTDGTIEVSIRRGHSELVQLFEDEDDLARRKPKLYKKYERLMSSDDE